MKKKIKEIILSRKYIKSLQKLKYDPLKPQTNFNKIKKLKVKPGTRYG